MFMLIAAVYYVSNVKYLQNILPHIIILLWFQSGDECFLDVGDNNEIREFTSIHRSSKSSDRTVIRIQKNTPDVCFLILQSNMSMLPVQFLTSLTIMYNQVIGDNNLIMGSCHIAHDCKIGNNNIFANSTLLAGHVIVEVSPSFTVCYRTRPSVCFFRLQCLLKIDSSATNVGLCAHCRSNCCSSILSYWLICFHWWWICGMSFSCICALHCTKMLNKSSGCTGSFMIQQMIY